jgi:hypothetical protein
MHSVEFARLDVAHFMRTLGIASIDELRQADHRAVIAWERFMREVEHAAASTVFSTTCRARSAAWRPCITGTPTLMRGKRRWRLGADT